MCCLHFPHPLFVVRGRNSVGKANSETGKASKPGSNSKHVGARFFVWVMVACVEAQVYLLLFVLHCPLLDLSQVGPQGIV